MRTDKLMMNADPDTIAAFNRGRIFKAAAALTIVFGFAVLATIAPPHYGSDTSMPAVVQPSNETLREQPTLGRGAEVDDLPTGGVDMHG
ncbi:MAG: hypothetical protein M3Q28_07480 [Pseudomonadota bacterium]|nr:hypothetical protein [Pseudomonadota bacterium]